MPRHSEKSDDRKNCHRFKFFRTYSASSCEVQCGQRVASMEISLLQKGQILVVGAAGASSAFFFLRVMFVSAFMPLRSTKRTNAIIIKLITAVKNAEAKPAMAPQP